MKKFCLLIAVLLAVGCQPVLSGSPPKVPLYGLWLYPGDAGHNEAQVAAFMEKAHKARINTIVFLVKGSGTL